MLEMRKLLVSVDVGSTTTKIIALDEERKEIVYSDYRRHHAAQIPSVYEALERLNQAVPGAEIRFVLTGSGAKKMAEYLDTPYIQEVVANSVALRSMYDDVRTAIELGGQDAKMIFFRKDEKTGALNVADMRMNGSCAGGTGAFIDEVASILRVPVEELDAMARKGTCVYELRRAVFQDPAFETFLSRLHSGGDQHVGVCIVPDAGRHFRGPVSGSYRLCGGQLGDAFRHHQFFAG